MAFFTMNQDAQIFHDNQEVLNDQYLNRQIPEITVTTTSTTSATAKEDNDVTKSSTNSGTATPLPSETPSQTSSKKKEALQWSHPRFTLSQFQLYETKTRYYLIGTNEARQRYRVLQIHRTNPDDLVVIEDDVLYTEQEKARLLKMIEDGNLCVGGLQLVSMSIYGIVGFVKFTQGWYMIFITKRRQVAMLGGHYIYHIDDTRLVPIGLGHRVDKNSDEARYVATFQNIDLSKNFYFSYTYDITNSLQNNMTQPPLNKGQAVDENDQGLLHNDMFVWNHYLLSTGFQNLNSRSGWILPIIYGFVDQAKISVFGRSVVVTLIARRSRHFAGARFLKRGVNDKGYVANDVETEQIVTDMATTSFHSTDYLYGNPKYTSYVQHRGSIPLIWSQDTTNMSPKPPIELNVVDPFFSAAALHFENIFQRYGTPCIVLNLIKQKEKTKRESILGKEFEEAIAYLNQFLPDDKKIQYIAWDMSRASKSHDQDVIGYLENIAENTMETTGFFHSGNASDNLKQSRQCGILRTNCIDCLDRTNAAQFLMGKCALGRQLYALGVIASPKIDFDSDAVNIFTEMFHDHGDTIALQYGGSHLVNTMETYRKINQWTSHPRDMIESIRRFYANAFSDADKQDAINLFLGNFVTRDGQPMLWELSSDYHLHNQHPLEKAERRDYRHWYKKEVLEAKAKEQDPTLFQIPKQFQVPAVHPDASDLYQGYWVEYYEHKKLTSLDYLFPFNMNGTLKYRPMKRESRGEDSKKFAKSEELTKAEALDMSPFTVRPCKSSSHSNTTPFKEKNEPEDDTKADEKEKLPAWTIEGITQRNLEPSITQGELKEYKRYTQQFKNIEKLTVTHGDRTNYTSVENFPEFQQYQNYIHKNVLDEHPGAIKTTHLDEQVYHTYVDIPRRAASIQISREWSGNARKRYEGYAAYLRHGKYPSLQQPPQRQSSS